MSLRAILAGISTAIIFAACSGAENNAGKVLDNANSVVKSGSKKIWVDNGSTTTTDAEKKKNGES